MKIETIITPRVNLVAQTIEIEELTRESDLLDPLKIFERRAIHLVQLRDEATRNALIFLGWRPPDKPEERHSSTPVDDITRLRVRSHDPGASLEAAEKASKFAGSHAQRIIDVCSLSRPMATSDIATKAGLTVVQVGRRTHELKRDGRLIVAQLGEEDMVVDGYRCWLLAPTKS